MSFTQFITGAAELLGGVANMLDENNHADKKAEIVRFKRAFIEFSMLMGSEEISEADFEEAIAAEETEANGLERFFTSLGLMSIKEKFGDVADLEAANAILKKLGGKEFCKKLSGMDENEVTKCFSDCKREGLINAEEFFVITDVLIRVASASE